MNILVTAGNTMVLLDQVRAITNIFTGRTGAGIAQFAFQRGHRVTLLTSNPDALRECGSRVMPSESDKWSVRSFRTFDDLHDLLRDHLRHTAFDVAIHTAAVSDYQPAGVYAPSETTSFCEHARSWQSTASTPATMIDKRAGKVKSDEPEIWFRMKRTPKLIDLMRTAWEFQGVLVKFKLEVGVSEDELRERAERSRIESSADLMVANTLEGASHWALLGPIAGVYQRITRQELAECLLDAVEVQHVSRQHG